MDTTAIFDYLNGSEHSSNTVLVLSNTLYENFKYVSCELPGVQLMYEPLSVNQPEFLELLTTFGVTIKCSNQELLNNLSCQQNLLIGTGKIAAQQSVLIGPESLSPKFMSSALNEGYQRFLISNKRDMRRLADANPSNISLQITLAPDEADDIESLIKECPITSPISIFFGKELKTVSDVMSVGSKIHSVLDLANIHGKDIGDIIVGTVHHVGDISHLKAPILALKETLPGDIALTIELGQPVVESAVIIAAKITGKTFLDGCTKYELDLSMFSELAAYDPARYATLSTGDFALKTEKNSEMGTPARVIGNTGDDDDVIFSGSLGDVNEDGWILLVNAGKTDCRQFDLVLFDKNFRTLKAMKPMLTEYESNVLESTDILNISIRVTA